MSGKHIERATFTNMCMVEDEQGRILVQDRLNPNWPGVTFPGGHVEAEESFYDSVVREVREETGLTVENPVLCGIKQFTTNDTGRYVVLFYKANRFSGQLCESEEGNVFWIPKTELDHYPLADGFMDMFRVFCDETLSEICFHRNDSGDWLQQIV